jgi:hypothetical protein
MSQLNSGQCNFGERVTIDTNSLLECGKKPENRKTVDCEAILTEANCSSGQTECHFPGVTLALGQTHYAYVSPPGFKMRDFYNGNGKKERYINFNVSDLKPDTKFTLTYVLFDDHLVLKVNGTLLFCGNRSQSCTDMRLDRNGMNVEYLNAAGTLASINSLQSSSWKYPWTPNLNLVPYLKEGENVIYTKVFVGGGTGNLDMDFTVPIAQPCECKEVWDDNCANFGTLANTSAP